MDVNSTSIQELDLTEINAACRFAARMKFCTNADTAVSKLSLLCISRCHILSDELMEPLRSALVRANQVMKARADLTCGRNRKKLINNVVLIFVRPMTM